MTDTVEEAFEHFARVAVLVEKARVQEQISESQPLDALFRQLENHGEHGLYQIMCNIHLVHQRLTANNENVQVTASPLSEVKTAEISRLKRHLIGVSSADRHRRNYILLADFERVLYKLLTKFTTITSQLERELTADQ